MQPEMILTGLTFAIAIIALVISVSMLISLKRIRKQWELVVLFFLLFIYALGYGLELASDTIELKVAFNHLQYVGIPFISAGWAFLAHRYRNPGFSLKTKYIILLLLIPFVSFISVQLSYYTDYTLYYRDAFIDQANLLLGKEVPVLVFVKGPLYYLGASYNMAMILYATFIYFRTFKKTAGVHKHQALFLTICSLIAGIAPVLTFTSNQTSGIDLAIYIVAGLSYIVLYALLRFEFLYLAPAAYRQAFHTASESMYLFDDKMELISWNNAVAEDEVTSVKVQYHMRSEELFQNTQIIEAIKEGAPYSLNDNNKHYVIETIPVISRKGHKDGYIVKFNDMTNYIERIEKLDYQASHDELTDIYNRRAFIEMGTEYIKASGIDKTDFALMMIDLDDFKQINDNYGHPFGDEVLKGVTKAIRESIDAEDILSRYGGEEFVVVAKNANADKAAEIAENIRSRVAALKFRFKDEEITTNVSIGVCLSYHDNPLDIYEYIKNADDALYVSKRKGKNKVTIV